MPWAPLQEKGRPKKLLILYLIFSRQSYLFGNRPTKRGREESGKSTYIIFINSFIWTFSLSLSLTFYWYRPNHNDATTFARTTASRIAPCHMKMYILSSVTSKKLPNVYKICPKMISLEKLKILTPLQKLLKNVGDFGKLIVAKGFKKFPKVQ